MKIIQHVFAAEGWGDYELLDFGEGEKLERFGEVVFRRPEVQATGARKLAPAEWENLTWAKFKEGKNKRGFWHSNQAVPEAWCIEYQHADKKLVFNLKLTEFKHVGIFPEQRVNWDFILRHANSESRVLNLFAYTGGASIAARAAGAHVTHVDSIKSVVTWANQNMVSSGLEDIRWLVEDAMKFAAREQRRGNLYDMVILDPPTFGLGPKGQRWRIEDQLEDIIETVEAILRPNGWMILNTYSGIAADQLERLVMNRMRLKILESGPLVIVSSSGRKMTTGHLLRAQKS